MLIEEPEAHTHPQMQYVFIENINKLLDVGIPIEKNGAGEIIKSQPFQYVISTHSSHIVANCQDFNVIKYLKKENVNDIKSKNLKDLQKEYNEAGEEKNYRFLKQYLTLNRAELFFADKAIFIEGDTERILLPAMMKKIDIEEVENNNELDLLSQNISIVEVGAHSQIFEKFIDFIGIKSLIVTDLDCYYTEPILKDDGTPDTYKNGNVKFKELKCPASDLSVKFIKNNALIFFHRTNDIDYIKKLSLDWKVIRKNRKRVWKSNRKGKLLIVFQTEEKGYHARSFEDAFFHLNNDFICENVFEGLTDCWHESFKTDKKAFDLAENGVNKKPTLAIDILLSDSTYTQWQIPAYIKEGLLWLKKD